MYHYLLSEDLPHKKFLSWITCISISFSSSAPIAFSGLTGRNSWVRKLTLGTPSPTLFLHSTLSQLEVLRSVLFTTKWGFQLMLLAPGPLATHYRLGLIILSGTNGSATRIYRIRSLSTLITDLTKSPITLFLSEANAMTILHQHFLPRRRALQSHYLSALPLLSIPVRSSTTPTEATR